MRTALLALAASLALSAASAFAQPVGPQAQPTGSQAQSLDTMPQPDFPADTASAETDMVPYHVPGTMLFYAFAAFPTGDFGDKRGEDAGLAGFGAGGGLEYAVPIKSTPISWTVGGGLIVNGLQTEESKQDARAMVEGVFDVPMDANTSVSGGSYFNAALLAGLRIGGRIAPGLAPYVLAQGGVVFVNQGDIKISDDARTATLASDPAFAPGFQLGAGLAILEHLSLGLRFFTTGDAKMKGTLSLNDGQSESVSGNLTVSVLALALGVTF